ncbi:MAG TPA: hypothetical protein VF630_19920 [Hymenobacter sp.]
MKSFLLAALLITSLVARAQTYYLDLSVQTLDVPIRTMFVEQVLDGRTGNPALGIVYRGLGGKSAAVDFRKGLEPELTAFIQAQLPARLTDHPVVLCLRSLHVGETMGGNKEQATADLTADVYERLPDGYHFVQAVGAQASGQGREVTGRHAGHVALLLTQSFNQLAAADWAAVAARPARTLAQLRTDAPAAGHRSAAARILREVPRRGIYYRFEQFLANRPDTTWTFRLDTVRRHFRNRLAEVRWLGVARVRPLLPNDLGQSPVAATMWGFSDGRQVFVRYDKQFYPLTRQGNFFTFVGEAPTDQLHAAAEAQAQGRAAVIGGAIGGAVARTSVVDHTAEPMVYGLDLVTGALGPYPGPRTPVRPDTAYVYVYRPMQAAASAAPVKVYVEGREVGALGPGTYLEMPWARYGKPMRLCLEGLPTRSPCQYLVPNAAQLNYLKLDPANATQPWQWVPARQGSADLDELDKRGR